MAKPRKHRSDAQVTARAMAQVRTRGEELLAEYRKRFGNVLNADNAAELFPDYAASIESRTKCRAAVHPATQWVRDELFQRSLADKKVKEVVFTAGGNGAGKTAGSPSADIVMDSTLSNPEHSAKLVEQALDSGKDVIIVYTFRSIEEALSGVLERSRTDGRTVPIDMLIQTHSGAARTVSQLYERYASDPRVQFQFIDNSRPVSRRGSIALTRQQNYSEARDRLHAILESQRSEVTGSVYRITKGAKSRGAGGPDRLGGH